LEGECERIFRTFPILIGRQSRALPFAKWQAATTAHVSPANALLIAGGHFN
jgi:hypothetical protein